MIRSKLFVLIVAFYFSLASSKFVNVNLPEGHLKYYFNSFPTEKQKCEDNPDCPYKVKNVFSMSLSPYEWEINKSLFTILSVISNVSNYFS